MSRHTSGPWRVDLRDDGVYRVDAQEVDGWRFVARMLGSDQQANARLIAAAPELLEAAKGALARYPELNALRAAVEKAEQ